jgi:hypothetical protein
MAPLALTTITAAIATLGTGAGVTIKDVTAIPSTVNIRDCPIMFPEPLNFVSNILVTTDTYGYGGSAKKTLEYDLIYTFCYAPVDSGRGLFDIYSGMADKAATLLIALFSFDTLGDPPIVIDSKVNGIENFGPVYDPAGNEFYGCHIILHIKQLVEV